MSKENILGIIKNLACSQGCYGRILERLQEDPGQLMALVEFVNDAGIKDAAGLVMLLEE